MEANYLYSCEKFLSFQEPFLELTKKSSIPYSKDDDLYHYLERNATDDTLKKQYQDVILERASTQTYFTWTTPKNGMLMPARK